MKKTFPVARFARAVLRGTEERNRFAAYALSHQRSGNLPGALLDDYAEVLIQGWSGQTLAALNAG